MAKKKEVDLEKELKKEVVREKELKKEERCNKAFALQEKRIKLGREKFEFERCNKTFALREERIKLERGQFEFEREVEEDKIISLDLSTMTYDQVQYCEDRTNKILARRLTI